MGGDDDEDVDAAVDAAVGEVPEMEAVAAVGWVLTAAVGAASAASSAAADASRLAFLASFLALLASFASRRAAAACAGEQACAPP